MTASYIVRFNINSEFTHDITAKADPADNISLPGHMALSNSLNAIADARSIAKINPQAAR